MGDLTRRATTPTEIVNYSKMSLTEKKEYADKTNDFIREPLKEWQCIEQKIDILKSKIFFPTILLAIGLVFDSTFIIFSKIVNSYSQNIEIFTLSVFLLFHIYTIEIIIRNIYSLIKE